MIINNFNINGGGGGSSYELPVATDSTLGGIKVGTGLTINSGGTLSANGYALPTASNSTKGGIKVGSGLTMSGEFLNSNYIVTNDISTLGSNAISVSTGMEVTNGYAAVSFPAGYVKGKTVATQVCQINGVMNSWKIYVDESGITVQYKASIASGFAEVGTGSWSDSSISLSSNAGSISNISTGSTYSLRLNYSDYIILGSKDTYNVPPVGTLAYTTSLPTPDTLWKYTSEGWVEVPEENVPIDTSIFMTSGDALVISTALNDLEDRKVESTDIHNVVKITQSAYDTLVAQSATTPTTMYIVIG